MPQKHCINGTMVATVPRTSKRGRPPKPVTADAQIVFRIEKHVKDALDLIPAGERRGYFRRLVIKDLLRRKLIDGTKLAD